MRGGARAVIEAARAGDARGAIDGAGSFRVLCAHRRGAHGVAVWTARSRLARRASSDRGRWYPGRPLLVTENDYGLRLYNGDTGVVVAKGAGRVARRVRAPRRPVAFAPTRLSAVDTVYAMTIHKSQGSQFGTAAVLLPDAESQILTRELLYTAVTRARRAADPGRHRGDDPRRGRPAGRARVRTRRRLE